MKRPLVSLPGVIIMAYCAAVLILAILLWRLT